MEGVSPHGHAKSIVSQQPQPLIQALAHHLAPAQHAVEDRRALGRVLQAKHAIELPDLEQAEDRRRGVDGFLDQPGLDDDVAPGLLGHADEEGPIVGIDAEDAAPWQDHERPRVEIAHDATESLDLIVAGEAAGNGLLVPPDGARRQRGGETGGPGGHGPPDLGLHALDLAAGRLPFGRLVAQDVAANRRVAYIGDDVDAQPAFQHGEVLRKTFPFPRDTSFEGLQRHALDLGEGLGHVVPVLGADGRQGVAAVAGNDGGHTVPGGRERQRVPAELGIVVGVRVDEAWGYDETVSIDRPMRAPPDAADVGDDAALDAHVGVDHRQARAVDDGAVLDNEVVFQRWPRLVCLYSGPTGMPGTFMRMQHTASAT